MTLKRLAWPMFDAVAQDVDSAALCDLALKAREELAAGGSVVAGAGAEVEGGGDFGLAGRPQSQPTASGSVQPGSQGEPGSAVQIRRSRPRSLVSVVTSKPRRGGQAANRSSTHQVRQGFAMLDECHYLRHG